MAKDVRKAYDHYRAAWGDLPSIAPHLAMAPGLTTGSVLSDLSDAADEVDCLREENRRLREVLAPFAFLENETTQAAWEIRYQDRFKDWIDFGDIQQARAELGRADPQEPEMEP